MSIFSDIKRNSHKSSPMSWIQNEANMNKKHNSWKNAYLSNTHQSVIRNKSKGIRPTKGKIHFAN